MMNRNIIVTDVWYILICGTADHLLQCVHLPSRRKAQHVSNRKYNLTATDLVSL
jgi:hypothetical protein